MLGILYWDRIEKWNLLSEDSNFHYAGTNPCAEEPLPAGGSCLLGSINLSEFVSSDKQFDFNSFREAVGIAVEALNEVLDEGLPLHPLQEQRDSVRDWRQIGLGVMGIADMLIKMEIPYDSEEAMELCDTIGFHMANEALYKSGTLAYNYGMYPNYSSKIEDSNFFKNNTSTDTKSLIKQYGLHNSQLLTIAPTGTLSTMLGISGGIEPIYANSYTRKTESLHGKDVYYKVYTPIVDRYMKEHNLEDESQLPKWFVTASTIDPMRRIQMQATWQKHIDASISSTVNLPNETTVEEIKQLYTEAWKQGLKGMTIYRDGCKRSGILSTSNTSNSKSEENILSKRGEWKKIAPDTVYYKRKIKIGCGKLNLFIGWSDSEKTVQELWVKRTGQGGCEMNIQASVIAMSGMLRLGGNIFNIEKAFEGLGACNSFIAARGKGRQLNKGSSCATAILNEIKAFLAEKNKEEESVSNYTNKATETKTEYKNTLNQCKTEQEITNKTFCPECGEKLAFEGGCIICRNCGYSKCE